MDHALPEYFYKYMSRSTAEIVLKNRTLRWSRPATFNDPFDVQFDLHLEIDEQKLRKLALDKLWDAFYGSTPYWPSPGNTMGALIAMGRDQGLPIRSRAQFDQHFGPGVAAGLKNAEAHLPQHHQAMRAILDPAKILCLSEVGDSIPMWSYYAEQHKGVVLRLIPLKELDSLWLAARPVTYAGKMPRLFDEEVMSNIIAGMSSTTDTVLLNSTVFTKAIEWAHEKEWRLYAGDGWEPSKAFEDVAFNQQELDAVLLGCAMPNGDRKHITELIREHFPAAKILQAKKHDREFSLIMEEVGQ